MTGLDRDRFTAEQFARFRQRPDVRDVADRYADWSHTPDGILISVQLAFLATCRLRGSLSRGEYRKAVRNLAETSGIPLRDFLVLAKCQLAVARCALTGSGQLPFGSISGNHDQGDE